VVRASVQLAGKAFYRGFQVAGAVSEVCGGPRFRPSATSCRTGL